MYPIVLMPGYLAGAIEYHQLEQSLHQYGCQIFTVPLRRWDWLPTLGGRSMVPILRQLHQTVQTALEQTSRDRVNLVCHSAGGWIARIYLGEKPYCIHGDVLPDTVGLWNARFTVASLITLGTPHTSQERWTRRNLDFVNNNYPGAFYATEIPYICVAGKSVFGQQWRSWLAYNSYLQTCGAGDCWGDGITPIVAAHLEGATNLTLDGIWHSPKGDRLWYGSLEAVEPWIQHLR